MDESPFLFVSCCVGESAIVCHLRIEALRERVGDRGMRSAYTIATFDADSVVCLYLLAVLTETVKLVRLLRS